MGMELLPPVVPLEESVRMSEQLDTHQLHADKSPGSKDGCDPVKGKEPEETAWKIDLRTEGDEGDGQWGGPGVCSVLCSVGGSLPWGLSG